MYLSVLTVDVPSKIKPGHLHKAGTEFAPVRRLNDTGLWEIEIRVDAPEPWWETLEIMGSQTTVVFRSESPQPS